MKGTWQCVISRFLCNLSCMWLTSVLCNSLLVLMTWHLLIRLDVLVGVGLQVALSRN